MELTESETQSLVERAAAGESSAVSELLRRHQGRLRQMVRCRIDPRLQSRVDPSDVVQEAYAVATKSISNYLSSQPIPFYPWLRRIAWQALLHQHEKHLDAEKRTVRREQNHRLRTNDESTMQLVKLFAKVESTPSKLVSIEELRTQVKEALNDLSPLDSEVLLQRYVEQLSIKEIAAGLELTEAAVYKRHARALERLRSRLEESTP